MRAVAVNLTELSCRDDTLHWDITRQMDKYGTGTGKLTEGS
jgi:hypothetical protein